MAERRLERRTVMDKPGKALRVGDKVLWKLHPPGRHKIGDKFGEEGVAVGLPEAGRLYYLVQFEGAPGLKALPASEITFAPDRDKERAVANHHPDLAPPQIQPKRGDRPRRPPLRYQ